MKSTSVFPLSLLLEARPRAYNDDMPTRNSRKIYTPETYYHVYTRGVNKQVIFNDSQDYQVLLSYLQRYLSSDAQKLANRQPARSFVDDVDLLCYCLMPNHMHLLFYLREDERALADLLQRVFTTYSMYFNKKYNRVGPLFQGRYLASPVDNDSYLYHISRYIHRNPQTWSEYEYSSLKYYTGEAHADWVKPHRILSLFKDTDEYIRFLASMDEDDEETAVDYLAHE